MAEVGEKEKQDVNDIIHCIMECSANIRRQLGPGYLENVYKNAMVLELRRHHLKYRVEQPIKCSLGRNNRRLLQSRHHR